MNLRWLLGNFTDPQYRLPVREQFRLSSLAHERHITWGVFTWRTLIVVAPFVISMFVLHDVITALGLPNQKVTHLVALATLVLLLWPWSAWVYRSMYVRPIRMIMREKGYDLCLDCGYDLRGQTGDTKRCPECGAQRVSEAPEGGRTHEPEIERRRDDRSNDELASPPHPR